VLHNVNLVITSGSSIARVSVALSTQAVWPVVGLPPPHTSGDLNYQPLRAFRLLVIIH